MGEETGRKSALRHVNVILFLAVILAISLAPAIALRVFPRETVGYLVDPVLTVLGHGMGSSKEVLTAIWMVTSFVVTIVTASALVVILAGELIRSVRENG
jgi:hypothetical protein